MLYLSWAYKQPFMCLVRFSFSLDFLYMLNLSHLPSGTKVPPNYWTCPKCGEAGETWFACSEWLRDLPCKFYEFFLDLSAIGQASSE